MEDFMCNVLIMGKTGTGKSTLLNYLIDSTEAPTGTGKPVTGEGIYEYTAKIRGQEIRIFDSWGIEAGKVDRWNALIKNALEKVVKNQKLFKSLAIGKFATATTLTALTYFGLTKFRHKYTENQIKKEFYANQQKEQNQQKNLINFSSSFDNVHKNKKVSFTGGLQDFMFSPLKNMMILDGVIVLINEETDMKIQNLLHNIANNINQIAKRANATGSIYAQDIAEIQEGVERIWQQQKSFQSNILKYRQSNILPIHQKPTTED